MLTNLENDFDIYQNVIREISPCMNDYLYVYDISRDLYYITESAVQRFAMDECCFRDVIEKHKKFVHPDDYDALQKDLKKLCAGEMESHDMTYRWIGRGGYPVWINCKGRIVRDAENKPYLMIGCINEIGRRQGADNVSGLLGEVSFYQYMKTIPELKTGFVLRIGIDDLRKINVRLGISKGDEVLYSVAGCVKRCLSENQRVYRVIDGEFLILDFSENATQVQAKQLYRQIRSEIDLSLEAQQYELLYTISGGILEIKNMEAKTTDELQKLSQFTLSIAKEKGKNQCYCFDREDYTQFLWRRRIAVKMRQAISNDFAGFYLVYQPIVNIVKGKLLGAESLLRFCDTDGTNFPPSQIVPILEESGLIIPVGKWVLKTALQTCKEMRKYQSDFKVSVNLSYIQLKKSAIYNDICNSLEQAQLDPSALMVELTESGELEDNSSIQHVWEKLKEKGVGIAVDDFGSGYSNLKFISELQPDYVKIDREFTIKAMKSTFDFLLLENIINMAHSLNGKFVVEGIEKKEELERIMKFSPEYIQGYYFGKPVPREAFIEKYAKEADHF